MDTIIINFKVTPIQKQTIDSRAMENGFDDVSAYLKVVALKTQRFTITAAGLSNDDASIELEFKVTKAQETVLEAKMKENDCSDLPSYLKYVALHGVITAIIEVRSTQGLDDMLARIAKSRNIKF